MNRFSSVRVLVATTFAVSSCANISAHAAPSLPLPAEQKPTPTPKAVAKTPAQNIDEPFIAPPNVDVPLRRETPQLAPTSSGAGPLPRAATIPTRRVEDLARDNAFSDNNLNTKIASVGGVRIEGMTDAAALRELHRAFDAKLRDKITLYDSQKSWTLSRQELGASIPFATLIAQARRSRSNVALHFRVDKTKAVAALRGLSSQVNRVVGARADGIIPVGMTVSRGSQRVALSVGGSTERVRQAIESRPPRTSVELAVLLTPVKTDESSTRTSKTSPYKDAPYLLAEFSTPYDSSIAGRTTNLKLAARNVDGTVIQPGRTFSTNLAIGRRNAANGWKEAKMFMDGQVVNGIGSGICQCATTLYNAALLAGLPIIERHGHTFRVSYAPASRDATIYWGSKDFRFRNNTSGPIYVRTFLKNERFHVELYGVAPVTDEIEISSRVLSRKGGTRSEAFRIIKTSSGVKEEKLSSDFYRPHP